MALPADFLQVIDLYRDTDPRYALRPTTTNAINQTHDTSGIPAEYAIVDGYLKLNPEPSGSENLELRYYARLADLSADGDENDILTNYPGIYIYGALAHHGQMVDDPRAPAWRGQYEAEKRRAKVSEQNAKQGSAPMRPTVRVVA